MHEESKEHKFHIIVFDTLFRIQIKVLQDLRYVSEFFRILFEV